MPKTIAVILLVLTLTGCQCTPSPVFRPPSTGEIWDTTYLLDAQPSLVTDDDLAERVVELTDHYMTFVQVLGVTWTPYHSEPELDEPDGYRIGGDSALFTGFALANFCFENRITQSNESLAAAMLHLRGIYYLTHIAGKGVIARCAFPLADKSKFGYPDEWAYRISRGFVGEGPAMTTPWGNFPESAYYTRATKDQLTGILFGLTVAWEMLDEHPIARPIIADIMEDLHSHLTAHGWKIRDADGNNDTSADKVSGFLRLVFESLYRKTVALLRPDDAAAAETRYLEWFHTLTIKDVFNIGNNFQEYFAHNLRATRAFTIWLLETDPDRRAKLAAYIFRGVWRYTHKHQNAWIAAVVAATHHENVKSATVLRSALQSISLRPLRAWGSPLAGQERKPEIGAVLRGCDGNFVIAPHLRKPTNYWMHQKEPWDTGVAQDPKGQLSETGLDLLLPYWVGKFFGSF